MELTKENKDKSATWWCGDKINWFILVWTGLPVAIIGFLVVVIHLTSNHNLTAVEKKHIILGLVVILIVLIGGLCTAFIMLITPTSTQSQK